MQESLFYRLLGITCHNSAFLTISPFVNSVNSFPYFFRNSSAMHKSNKNGLASLLATRQFCWICIWRSAISENLRCIAAYRWWNHQFELIWLNCYFFQIQCNKPFRVIGCAKRACTFHKTQTLLFISYLSIPWLSQAHPSWQLLFLEQQPPDGHPIHFVPLFFAFTI